MPIVATWLFTGLTWLLREVLWKFLVLSVIAGIVKIAVGIGLAQIFAILAIGTISYQGVAFSIDWVVSNMSLLFSQLPPDQFEILSMVGTRLRLDDCLTVIFTAFVTVISLWTFKGAWGVFGIGQG